MSFEIIEGNTDQPADFAKEISDNSFETDVLIASENSPVIVIFYSSLNASCARFVDMTIDCAKNAKGKINAVKANVDKCNVVTQALQIQNIPTVYAFFQGRPIDGFTGIMPEEAVIQFINKISALNSTETENEQKQGLSIEEVTKIMTEADELMSDENYDDAMEKYSMLLEDDEKNMDALAGIGWCLASQGDMESVREMLGNLNSEQKNATRIKGLKFIANIQPIEKIENLEKKILGDDELDKRYELAKAFISEGNFDSSIEHLVKIISQNREWEDGKAHKFLLQLFESLGNSHSATRRGKRKLSTVLFS